MDTNNTSASSKGQNQSKKVSSSKSSTFKRKNTSRKDNQDHNNKQRKKPLPQNASKKSKNYPSKRPYSTPKRPKETVSSLTKPIQSKEEDVKKDGLTQPEKKVDFSKDQALEEKSANPLNEKENVASDFKRTVQESAEIEALEALQSEEANSSIKENYSRPHHEEEILKLIRTITSPILLQEQLDTYHANDIADAVHDLTSSEREKFYKLLDAHRLSEILEYMDEDDPALQIDEMSIVKILDVLSQMEPDKATAILKEMSEEKRQIILQLLPPETSNEIELILSFNDDTIGSKMTTNYIEVPKGLTVKEATEKLIEQAADNDNISTIYVKDENGLYYGAVTLKDLIISRAHTPLEEIIITSYPYVYAQEPIDRVVEDLKDYNEDSIPVLSHTNSLIGVITAQDLLEVMDEEMGEDYAMLAGLAGEEDLEESMSESLRKRLPWLITLLFLGLVVSVAVSFFEGVVARLTVVMAFQSLILGMAGNAGTQSLGVTIRVLMDESLDRKQKYKLMRKEVSVGFCNGLLLGFVSFLVLGLYIHFFKFFSWFGAYSISLCIGVALWVSMIISSFTGTVFPIFFKKIGVDPAVASGPLITTINDLVGVCTYYGLAWIFLIEMLHLH